MHIVCVNDSLSRQYTWTIVQRLASTWSQLLQLLHLILYRASNTTILFVAPILCLTRRQSLKFPKTSCQLAHMTANSYSLSRSVIHYSILHQISMGTWWQMGDWHGADSSSFSFCRTWHWKTASCDTFLLTRIIILYWCPFNGYHKHNLFKYYGQSSINIDRSVQMPPFRHLYTYANLTINVSEF